MRALVRWLAGQEIAAGGLVERRINMYYVQYSTLQRTIPVRKTRIFKCQKFWKLKIRVDVKRWAVGGTGVETPLQVMGCDDVF